MTLYDEAGVLPQCAEAPTAYMMGCVRPSDYVAYLRSWRPVLKEGAHCEAMGNEFQSMDNIYPLSSLYWQKGHTPNMSAFYAPYFANHSQAFAFLNKSRDETPACRTVAAAGWSQAEQRGIRLVERQ